MLNTSVRKSHTDFHPNRTKLVASTDRNSFTPLSKVRLSPRRIFRSSESRNEIVTFIGPCIIAIIDEWNTNLMSLAILFHLLCAQHVSDINMSIFRSLRLCWWITTSVVLFSVCCVLELLLRLVFGGVRFAGFKSSNTQQTENKTTDVVIHQHSRRLLKMDILMSETCWAHNKWNKIACDIKLGFHSSTVWNCYAIRTVHVLIVVLSSTKCTLRYTIYDIYQLLHVSAPRCHSCGVIITKAYEPTCQCMFCSSL